MKRGLSAVKAIRGMACFMVLVGHASGFSLKALTPFVGPLAKIGVWLFFVLSAFLLTLKINSSGISRRSMVEYGIGRFARIVPMYWLAVCIYFFGGSAGIDSVADLLDAALMRKGYAHLWTIPVEFKFYFLLPVIVLLVGYAGRWGAAWQVMTCGLIALLCQILYPFWMTPENSAQMRWYVASFVVGVACAILYAEDNEPPSLYRVRLVVLLTVAFLVLAMPFSRNILFGMPYGPWLRDKFVFISLVWGVFLFFCADRLSHGGFLRRMFDRIGECSFSIYLIHWLVMFKVAAVAGDSISSFFMCILLSVIAGMVLYHVVEAPLQRMRYSGLKRFSPAAAR